MTDSKMRELLPTEVITFSPGGSIQHPTCQVRELIRILKSNAGYPLGNLLSENGLECQTLCFGAESWRSGRLKLVIKFEPDPSDSENQESSLDELRRLAGS